MAFRCNNPPCWIFIDILMPIRHLVQMIEAAPVAMTYSLIRIQCHGSPTNKRLYFAILQNPSIVLLRLLLRRLFGFNLFYRKFVSLPPLHLYFGVIMKVQLTQLLIQCSMLGPNTLSWIFTLYRIEFLVNNSSFNIFLHLNSLLIFSLNIFQVPSFLVSKRSSLLFLHL